MKNSLVAEVSLEINSTPAQVWKALTTPSLIRKYLMGTNVTSNWEAGSSIIYEGEYNGKQYHDKGTIKNIIPEKLLQSTYWSSMSGKDDREENYNLVTYALTSLGAKTVLTVTQDNIADENERQHSLKNWHDVLAKMREVVENEKMQAH